MGVKVTAVVPLSEESASFGNLVTSLDEQTLSYSEFDVRLVDLGLADGESTGRAARLCRRRPNMRLVETEQLSLIHI